MVQPEEKDNATLMQRREPDAREARGAGTAPLPYPGEIVGRKAPPFEVTGADALSPLLMHVDFPATREEIIATIGQARIPVDAQHTMSVAEVLARTGPASFRSSTEVEHAVNRIWDDIRPHDDRGGHPWQADNLTGRKPN